MRFTLLLITSLSFITVYTQKLDKEISNADYLLYDELFLEAYEAYQSISVNFPESKEHKYHQLIAYHLSVGRGESLDELLAYEETMGAKDEFYNYWLGRIHLTRYEFDVSINHLKAFLKMRAYKSSGIVDDTKFLLEWAQSGKEFYENIDEYELYQLGDNINTEKSEVGPVFFKDHDELLFFREIEAESNIFKIHHGFKNGDEWDNVSPIGQLGTFTNFETRAEILSNNQLLFYKREAGGDVFYSDYKEGSGWSKPAEYDPQLKANITSDFFINNDENMVLYSSSVKQEGDQVDIFQIRKQSDGTWGKAEKLNINTEYDEDFPFLTDDEKFLYFSSNRPESIGGYDIFRSEWDEYLDEWGDPENVGFPINTLDDEFYFQMNHGTNTGFLSSNRLHTKGGLDVYYFFKVENVSISGEVRDLVYDQPIPDLEVKFHPIRYTDESIVMKTNIAGQYLGELIANESFEIEYVLDNEVIGRDTLHVGLEASKKDFVVKLPKHHLTKIDYSDLYKGGDKERIEVNMLANKFRKGNKAIIKNIYFEFESDVLSKNSEEALDNLFSVMSKNDGIKLIIEGHTDNVGDKDYNKKLSLSRAMSVKNALIDLGIDANRLETVGYGESFPLASNDDEKDGRELNRRIEVLLVE
ncbi:MAG: OmpA family protein [Ekhidna sp.]